MRSAGSSPSVGVEREHEISLKTVLNPFEYACISGGDGGDCCCIKDVSIDPSATEADRDDTDRDCFVDTEGES